MRVDVCLRRPNIDLSLRSAHCGSTLHTYDCCTGADPRRLDRTSTRSCSGFMPGGMVISSSMFSRYRKVKGISRRLPPESVAKSARPGLPSTSPSTDRTTTPLTTVSGFMGWTRVTRTRNLFAVAVATIRACWIFTSAEFAFWVTIPGKRPIPGSPGPPGPADRRSCAAPLRAPGSALRWKIPAGPLWRAARKWWPPWPTIYSSPARF